MSNTTNKNTKAKAKKTTEQKIITSVEKLLELATVENVTKILANKDIFTQSLTKSELLKVVIFNEIKKALDNDTHEAILQCNFDCTQHPDANAYNLIRFVERAKHQNALTNIYITVKHDKIFCKCMISAHKTYQDAFAKADFDIVRHCKIVELKDLTNTVKIIYSVFNSTH